MKIGIAGTGGIGSNVAVHLVRSGVRWLKLVDFDCLEPSNLNRQFYFHDQLGRYKAELLAENLARIAPDAQLEPAVLRLNAANIATVFKDCDAVVEGFDGRAEKKMLLEALASSGQMIVSASGVAGIGLDHIQTRRMGSCTIIGDFTTDVSTEPVYAPKVAIVAALMAHEILEKGGFYERNPK
ncbi:MAG: sulfur carrier protein ThiS adenylyltransferase ThiF [Desulfobacteraceae bacterium]|nr:sulfur carrier protein ThiS adenylyltransferase ThiF [Desulfobacteraceae bacterium]